MTAPTAHPTQSTPRAMGSPDEAYTAVLERLAGGPEKRILDAPAGRGALARLLVNGGFDVAACDIVPEIFEVKEVECRYANLNERLPYDDASFDAVSSCNGIHRVFSVGRAISEYARVLRPGGRLFVTVPNFTKLSRRIRFFFTGVISYAAARSAMVAEGTEGRYRQAVGLPEILLAAGTAGLELSHVRGLRLAPLAERLFHLPLVLLLRLGGAFIPARRRSEYFLRETTSSGALFGDFILVELRKPGTLLRR